MDATPIRRIDVDTGAVLRHVQVGDRIVHDRRTKAEHRVAEKIVKRSQGGEAVHVRCSCGRWLGGELT